MAPPGPPDPWRDLIGALSALGLTVPQHFPDAVHDYLDELARWNRVGRLTGYRTVEAQLRHLVLDSLLLLAVLPNEASPLLDIGSGAGVPGLILKLARPSWPITLIEAGRRRANFLRAVARRLGLVELSVEEGRAEDLGRGPLGNRFRTVTLRAVASRAGVEQLARPFLAPAGQIVVPLGPGASAPRGAIREVAIPWRGALPRRRRFLILDG